MSIRSFFLVILLSVFLVTGCGKKMWPRPVANQETFAWQKTVVYLFEDCLQIETQLTGNADNLDHLVVQLEYDQCPSCPFQPQEEQIFFLSTPGLKKEKDRIMITCCPNQQKIPARIRVIGYNRYRRFSPQISQVFTVRQGK